jgi:predicted amidohydrolase
MTRSRCIHAAVVQACTAAYDLDATLEKMARLTRVAKERDGAQLAVFPEALSVHLSFSIGLLSVC